MRRLCTIIYCRIQNSSADWMSGGTIPSRMRNFRRSFRSLNCPTFSEARTYPDLFRRNARVALDFAVDNVVRFVRNKAERAGQIEKITKAF